MITADELADLKDFVHQSREGNNAIGDAPIPSDGALRAVDKLLEERDQHAAQKVRFYDIVQKLQAELAENFPISVTAIALANDEASIEELREVITKIGNSTDAAKLEYLPLRLRVVP